MDFVVAGLLDIDPNAAWNLVEFVDPTTGRLYEIDMPVPSGQLLVGVEIKSQASNFASRQEREPPKKTSDAGNPAPLG